MYALCRRHLCRLLSRSACLSHLTARTPASQASVLYVKSRAKNQCLTTKSCTSGWTCIVKHFLFTAEGSFSDDARIYIFVVIYGVFRHIWVNRVTAEWVSERMSEWPNRPLTMCHPLHIHAIGWHNQRAVWAISSVFTYVGRSLVWLSWLSDIFARLLSEKMRAGPSIETSLEEMHLYS